MSYVPEHVENPSAWLDAKARRIKANANKTRQRALIAAIANDSEEFRCWLFNETMPEHVAMGNAAQAAYDASNYDENADRSLHNAYAKAIQTWRKRVGHVPAALTEALDNWGGLTEKQLAWARSTFKKNIERAEGRDAAEIERRANATPWTIGRQTISAVVQSARFESYTFAYSSSTSLKALLLLDDGRKCWTTLPRSFWPEIISSDESDESAGVRSLRGQRVEITVTIEISDDDSTMAFGKRPTLPSEKKPKTPRAAKKSAPIESEPTTSAEIVESVEPKSETKAEAKARRARARRAAKKAAQ